MSLFDQLLLVAVFDHQVYAQVLPDLLRIQTRVAAGHDQPRVGIRTLQTADLLA